jgi:hypothetical protein
MFENYFFTSNCGKYSREYFKHSFKYSTKTATLIIKYNSELLFRVTIASVQDIDYVHKVPSGF